MRRLAVLTVCTITGWAVAIACNALGVAEERHPVRGYHWE